MRIRTIAAAACLGLALSQAQAALVNAVWTNAGNATMGGVTIAGSGLGSPSALDWSFGGTNYDAAPLGSPVSSLVYGADADWTFTFSSPVQGLLLYVASWRGTESGSPGPGTNYEFSEAFTVLDGLSAGSVAGNTLTLGDNQFHSGILKFSGPISSLSLKTDASFGNQQILTLAYDPDAVTASVPLPGTLPLVAVGGVALLLRRRRPA